MLNQKILTEFLGTFFLVTVVAFTGNPIAIGVALMVLVYSGGHISGAHFNPAVTYAFYLKKAFTLKESLAYIAAQFGGALVASFFYTAATTEKFIPQPATTTSWPLALVIEIIFTFLLVKTILSVAADARVKGNQYYGLAIGGALVVGALIGGTISGGAYNPAVGVAPLLFDFTTLGMHLSSIALYILGPLAGAGLAVYLEAKK